MLTAYADGGASPQNDIKPYFSTKIVNDKGGVVFELNRIQLFMVPPETLPKGVEIRRYPTNNTAEYAALWYTIREFERRVNESGRLHIIMDSELIVSQVTKCIWKKWPDIFTLHGKGYTCKQTHLQVWLDAIMKKWLPEEYTLTWSPREDLVEQLGH